MTIGDNRCFKGGGQGTIVVKGPLRKEELVGAMNLVVARRSGIHREAERKVEWTLGHRTGQSPQELGLQKETTETASAGRNKSSKQRDGWERFE